MQPAVVAPHVPAQQLVYEVDALRCSRCGSPMKVLAVITYPPEVRKILLHLIKTSLAPPDVESSTLI